jgi:hypothetical protein
MDLDFNQILFLIGPTSGDLIWNILIYIIFFLALFTLFAIPDKNLISTLLMAGVLMALVVTKLNISIRPPARPIFPPRDFIQFTLNAVVFIFPLLVAGLIRARKKGAVLPLSIVTGLFGGIFFFLFWFFVQRG